MVFSESVKAKFEAAKKWCKEHKDDIITLGLGVGTTICSSYGFYLLGEYQGYSHGAKAASRKAYEIGVREGSNSVGHEIVHRVNKSMVEKHVDVVFEYYRDPRTGMNWLTEFTPEGGDK